MVQFQGFLQRLMHGLCNLVSGAGRRGLHSLPLFRGRCNNFVGDIYRQTSPPALPLSHRDQSL